MPRKRTPNQGETVQETTAGTALAERDHTQPIESPASFADRVGQAGDRPVMPDPFKIAGDYLAGVHLYESRQDRQVAIKFDDKPSQSVIETLKEAGYRWNPRDQVWAHGLQQETAMGTRIDAERLYQEVRQLVRQEKGLETGPEMTF